MTIQAIECLGVVLAGGLSSRMGQDKAQLKRQQRLPFSTEKSAESMLDFSKQLLANAGIKNIVVSGDNHQIPDRVANAGPVGGIYSVLAHYPEQLQPKALLILPVDLPLMTAAALSDLRRKGELSHKATFFHDSQKNSHHIPLYLPNNAFLQLFLKQAFQRETMQANNVKSNNKSGPSVRGMLEHVPHQAIASLNSQVLFNSNTPEQWQQAQKQF
ncbi:molybdenum cofactor guanylyltransferase [Colwellia psychrerythraea]|uniref:MobA-like NTP transferase domain containing protein n=1 Tax=Colwellia psychrerythraea TaxID=28229 RepID=A0A099KUX7_COLPS|nr:molybdenum cofactor guanylyltransferase [Colwellia psychrerythraea]KGJ94371.1 MobA-like NTP transferase domain containing protein [Colwellia psychrerythraea]